MNWPDDKMKINRSINNQLFKIIYTHYFHASLHAFVWSSFLARTIPVAFQSDHIEMEDWEE